MNKVVLKGDIYYADLSPSIKSEQGGVRPVLIIQNDFGNKFSTTTIVAAITSQINKKKLPTHVELDDLQILEKESVILTEQIRTIDKSRLREYRGKVDDTTMLQVQNALQVSFGMFC